MCASKVLKSADMQPSAPKATLKLQIEPTEQFDPLSLLEQLRIEFHSFATHAGLNC